MMQETAGSVRVFRSVSEMTYRSGASSAPV